MFGRKAVLCAMMVTAGAVLYAAGTPSVDELLAKMAEKSVEVKTIQAEMVSRMRTPVGTMTSAGRLVTKVVTREKRPVEKSYVEMTSKVPVMGTTVSTRVKIVNDGEFLWQETRTPTAGEVQVIKARVGLPTPGPWGPLGTFQSPYQRTDELKKTFHFRKVTEETLRGRRMWVLEGIARVGPTTSPATLQMMARVKYYVDRKDLGIRRMTTYSADGRETIRCDITHVKLDGKVDDALFKYTPPPYAKLMDMTKMQEAE